MAFPKDTRTVVLAGAGLAVLAGIAVALAFGAGRANDPNAVPPAAESGLKIEMADTPILEPTRELRCFVNGQFVGMSTLNDCARRNGVASSALDVGLDETGALAAAPTASFAPPPKAPVENLTVQLPAQSGSSENQAPERPASVADGRCLRFVDSQWRAVATGLSQSACVRALYEGTCVRTLGGAQYGRWNDMTLRLVPRRVEQSSDNSNFTTYANQNRSCQFTDLG